MSTRSPCDNCKEDSVVRKIYTTKDGQVRRVEYCINRGCKYRQPLPPPKDMQNE